MSSLFRGPQLIADILENSSQRFSFTRHVIEYRLRAAWLKAVGETISMHAGPARLVRGTLTVHVDSPVWVQELKLMAPDILSRLRKHPVGKKVDKIRFQIGSLPHIENNAPQLSKRLLKIELEPEALEELDKLCDPVSDPELRFIIRRVAEKDTKLRRLRETGGAYRLNSE